MKPLADCRLYTFVDTAYLQGRSADEITRQLIDGGADLIQLRAKDWSQEKIQAIATALLAITLPANIPLIINDYWTIATEVGAEFCHQGQEDYFEFGQRGSTPKHPQLGLSTHSPADAQRAMQAQAAYLAVGPIYPTPTKPDRSAVTLDYVRWATAYIDRPWFAIGGITLDNVDEVLEAGARRICVVSAILKAPDIPRACQRFHEHLASAPLNQTP